MFSKVNYGLPVLVYYQQFAPYCKPSVFTLMEAFVDLRLLNLLGIFL